MVENLHIGPPESIQAVIRAYFLYLNSIAEFGELDATMDNAETFTLMHLAPAFLRGEPILFASVDKRFVGATFTTLPTPELSYRVPFAYGHGTYVIPEFRRQGVACALLMEVRRRLDEIGVKRQLGMAHLSNQDSMTSFSKLGFEPHGIVMKFDL